jgi:hypothetical protein
MVEVYRGTSALMMLICGLLAVFAAVVEAPVLAVLVMAVFAALFFIALVISL